MDNYNLLTNDELEKLSLELNQLIKQREEDLTHAVLIKDVKTCQEKLNLMSQVPKIVIKMLKSHKYNINEDSFINIFLNKLNDIEKKEVLTVYFAQAIKDIDFFNRVKSSDSFKEFIKNEFNKNTLVNAHSDILLEAIELGEINFKLNHFTSFINNKNSLFKLLDYPPYSQLVKVNREKIFDIALNCRSLLLSDIADKLKIEKDAEKLLGNDKLASDYKANPGSIEFLKIIVNEFKFDRNPQNNFTAQMHFLHYLPKLKPDYWLVALEGLTKNYINNKDFMSLLEDRVYMASFGFPKEKENFKEFITPYFKKFKLEYSLEEKMPSKKIKI